MQNTAPVQGSFGDRFEDAAQKFRGLMAVLTRLCDAMASTPDRARAEDAQFWVGMRDMVAAIARASEDLQRAAEAQRPAARRAPERPDAVGLATTLASDALRVDIGKIIEDHQEGWSALVDAVRAERFPGSNPSGDSVEPLELYSRVITTLPSEMRRDFRRLTQWRAADEIVERQAAFELGRQIERRAREVAR